MKPLVAVPVHSPEPQTQILPAEWMVVGLLMIRRIAQLEAENAKLLRAVQRESHHMDQRSGQLNRAIVLQMKNDSHGKNK